MIAPIFNYKNLVFNGNHARKIAASTTPFWHAVRFNPHRGELSGKAGSTVMNDLAIHLNQAVGHTADTRGDFFPFRSAACAFHLKTDAARLCHRTQILPFTQNTEDRCDKNGFGVHRHLLDNRSGRQTHRLYVQVGKNRFQTLPGDSGQQFCRRKHGHDNLVSSKHEALPSHHMCIGLHN